MTARKNQIKPDMTNSIDFYNFCNANNDLPVLDILNERFNRSFRVTLSNHLRMISNISYNTEKVKFQDWVEENTNHNCMFIIKLKSLNAPIIIKLDRVLSYGAIDILTGGTGEDFINESNKEMTMIELSILKNLGLKIIEDLNGAWSPVQDIKAEYVRTEINAQFVGIVPPESKMIRVSHDIEFSKNKGSLEILYPYSTLFPVRDKLFS
jgi:flagellar motor switch protein FliM